jgi:NAD(P)-dependent dehydrogenase (short-subunit alcohol dehydrogenase family)
MIKDFSGKVAVITGGGSGIGRSLAHAFAEGGMKIVLSDINEESLTNVSDELRSRGAEVLSLVVDVSKPEQVKSLADAAYENFGRANILCNNAGVGGGGPMQFLTLADWEWLLGINLNGVIHGIHYFLPRMLASGEPCHIVNTASMAGHLSGESSYSASKFAVVSISETLKQECFNTNVGVSVLCPGFVDTGIMETTREFREKRSDFFQPSDEMRALAEPMIENFTKTLRAGMDPDLVAKKVIVAIEEDILHIITHPEFLPLIKGRFDSIESDTHKLARYFPDSAEKIGEGKKYEHKSPAFSLSYPANLMEMNPPPLPGLLFFATQELIISFFVFAYDKSDPALASDISPKTAMENLSHFVSNYGTEVNIISDRQITLKDDTPANRGEIEFRTYGFMKRKISVVAFEKQDRWISIQMMTLDNSHDEDFEKMVDSIEFQESV